MNRALFLDRDGVINADGDYLYRPEDINFLDGIFCLCRAAKDQGYRLIVATNQSGIARGYYTEEDFHRLTDWMCGKFTAQGAALDAVYFCPYHPEIGVGRYKSDSFDRKPKPGMLLKARNEFDLDLSKSILIGDRDSDMEAGRAAGVGRLLFLPGKYDCLAAADVILVRSLWDAKQYL